MKKSCGFVVDEWRKTAVQLKLKEDIALYNGVTGYLRALQKSDTLRVQMVEKICIHETSFFRHGMHFTHLEQMCKKKFSAYQADRPIRVWSVACSSGEEPYSIAMLLGNYFHNSLVNRFDVLATDISTQILEKARQAIWPVTAIESIPPFMREKYIWRGIGPKAGSFTVSKDLRKIVRFQQNNLMNPTWHVDGMFDFIFCRNVLIYFSTKSRTEIVQKIVTYLRPGGILYVGPSENITGMSAELSQIQPSIFVKIGDTTEKSVPTLT